MTGQKNGEQKADSAEQIHRDFNYYLKAFTERVANKKKQSQFRTTYMYFCFFFVR